MMRPTSPCTDPTLSRGTAWPVNAATWRWTHQVRGDASEFPSFACVIDCPIREPRRGYHTASQAGQSMYGDGRLLY